MKKLVLHGLLISYFMMFTASHSLASDLESLQILKVSQDNKAVVKKPEGKLQVVGVGDLLVDNAKVIEVSQNRLVLEQVTDHNIETIIIRLNGTEKTIERYSKVAKPAPRLTTPME